MPRLTSIVAAGAASTATAVVGRVASLRAAVEVSVVHDDAMNNIILPLYHMDAT